MSLDDALDFAVGIGANAVEIAAGGQSSAPHMRVFELLADAGRRAEFARKLEERKLRLAAVNCSAWPMHPREGDRHVEIIRAAIRLAGELGVDKIVTMSGCPGESAQARAIHWITFPWPDDRYAILDEQWDQAVALWHDLAAYAKGHGVTRIALELHPLQLVYNVPTLQRLRREIGPIIGANVDPSHMFWQQMDPVRVVYALGPAVFHVHLKDTEMRDSVGVNGVLDATPFGDIEHRSWIFRTVGLGHGAPFWKSFIGALEQVGYDDVLSIENEDPLMPAQVGAKQAADFITGLNDE
ncbi:MAG TPA: sugar phosphate isomerase/epimerase [Amycolatopsis sp.]|nr:sugar phosphate isomerase/epimerase [Amycolatopsis sp.]